MARSLPKVTTDGLVGYGRLSRYLEWITTVTLGDQVFEQWAQDQCLVQDLFLLALRLNTNSLSSTPFLVNRFDRFL
jgi:hypothetical protein